MSLGPGIQQPEVRGMWARYALFVALSFGIVLLNLYVMSVLFPAAPPKRAKQEGQGQQAARPSQPPAPEPSRGGVPGTSEAGPDRQSGGQPGAANGQWARASEAGLAEPAPDETLVTLGSLGPDAPYRMLVTLTTRGAAVIRVELVSPRYRDIEDHSGYLGHVVHSRVTLGHGCPVDVVGPGTPAAEAGLLPGDVILAVDGQQVSGPASLEAILRKTVPEQSIELLISRGGKPLTKRATLGRRPLEVLRPEGEDPCSFLLTLAKVRRTGVCDLDLTELRKAELEKRKQTSSEEAEALQGPEPGLGLELVGARLQQTNWYLLPPDADPRQPLTWKTAADQPADARATRDEVRFGRWLKPWGITVVKTYRVARVPPESLRDADFKAYHLTLEVAVYNLAGKLDSVAYQLDGPTGLPIEGAWYAVKMSNGWGGVGLRDVAYSLHGRSASLVSCTSIADGRWGLPWNDREHALAFVGVDAQYFSAILIPEKRKPEDIWLADARPICVGPVDPAFKRIANTSCRLTSEPATLGPGEALAHRYTVFVGPKRSALLDHYGLHGLIQYGWFWFVAEPMTWILHFFHDYVVFNYGLAIVLLTVLVRSSMFPISRKQALNAQKMQQLQPEMKKIQEKYKNLEQRNKAIQELYRKHNFNPLGGCLPLLIQLPIFIGLYKALAVDVELRGAPLIAEALGWCTNLAAPDMLLDWSPIFPRWFNQGQGMFALGPYFNLFPVLTIVLFLWQQKMFMPPPTDEQQAMQQKMMQFMMVFMGVLFFKVPSGLCVYFIASSLWGMAERRWLPKITPVPGGAAPAEPAVPAQKASVLASLLKPDGSPGKRRKKAPRSK